MAHQTTLNMTLAKRIVRRLLGSPQPATDTLAARRGQLLTGPREQFFGEALHFIDYEKVEGDIAEFGVFTGRTLAALALLNSFPSSWKFTTREIVGFDWFNGLRDITEAHERWTAESCLTNHETENPVMAVGERVSPKGVQRLFQHYRLSSPRLEVGAFETTVAPAIAKKYRKLALVHIDCDLYESTRTVLRDIAPALQEGTMILFDDWFNYKGNPHRGEQRAFIEFLNQPANPWRALHYRQYAIFCNAFIMVPKTDAESSR